MGDFELRDPTTVQPEMFDRITKYILALSLAELHILNEMTNRNFKIALSEFFTQLIQAGEHLEQYEVCSELQEKQRKYTTWVTTYQEEVEFISKIVTKKQ